MPFLKYNANPLDRRGNDCTIRAISLFTGKTWDEEALDMALAMMK